MFGSTLVLQQYDDAGIEYSSLHNYTLQNSVAVVLTARGCYTFKLFEMCMKDFRHC